MIQLTDFLQFTKGPIDFTNKKITNTLRIVPKESIEEEGPDLNKLIRNMETFVREHESLFDCLDGKAKEILAQNMQAFENTPELASSYGTPARNSEEEEELFRKMDFIRERFFAPRTSPPLWLPVAKAFGSTYEEHKDCLPLLSNPLKLELALLVAERSLEDWLSHTEEYQVTLSDLTKSAVKKNKDGLAVECFKRIKDSEAREKTLLALPESFLLRCLCDLNLNRQLFVETVGRLSSSSFLSGFPPISPELQSLFQRIIDDASEDEKKAELLKNLFMENSSFARYTFEKIPQLLKKHPLLASEFFVFFTTQPNLPCDIEKMDAMLSSLLDAAPPSLLDTLLQSCMVFAMKNPLQIHIKIGFHKFLERHPEKLLNASVQMARLFGIEVTVDALKQLSPSTRQRFLLSFLQRVHHRLDCVVEEDGSLFPKTEKERAELALALANTGIPVVEFLEKNSLISDPEVLNELIFIERKSQTLTAIPLDRLPKPENHPLHIASKTLENARELIHQTLTPGVFRYIKDKILEKIQDRLPKLEPLVPDILIRKKGKITFAENVSQAKALAFLLLAFAPEFCPKNPLRNFLLPPIKKEHKKIPREKL